MIVDSLVSPVLDANCYIVAPEPSAPAVVVDPGVLTAADVRRHLATWDLSVGAVLLTHGHLDHVWDAAEVAGDAPVYIPAPDLYRLDDPGDEAVMGPVFAPLVANLPTPWTKPADVRGLAAGEHTLVPGVTVRLVPAPGHSEGSALFFLAGPVREGAAARSCADASLICFDGDVIFAGSVGRTDLPGGDARQMLHTLRTLCNVVAPETILLPGHGPATTMDRESRTNPYLNQARHAG